MVAATNRVSLQLVGSAGAHAGAAADRRNGPVSRVASHLPNGVSLYVATLPLLQRAASNRTAIGPRLQSAAGPGSRANSRRPGRARCSLWVIELCQRCVSPGARIGGTETGRILDAAVIEDRVFLIGPRGLQVVDPSGERIIDSVDVLARERIDVAGRHLVMIGEKSLQVVDATPFMTSAPASDD